MLDKAALFVNVASDMYSDIVDGVYERERFTKRIRALDIDNFDEMRANLMSGILRDIHALQRHKYLDRRWMRLRERIDRRAAKFRAICEKEAMVNGI